MKTFMKIGEFLANPVVMGILLTIVVIPAFWGLFKLLEWLGILDSEREKANFIKNNSLK